MMSSDIENRLEENRRISSEEEISYFKVDDLTFSDLEDWGQKPEDENNNNDPNNNNANATNANLPPREGPTLSPTKRSMGPRSLSAILRSGRTGAATTVNLQPLALFRVRSNVYAIQQRCPHAGGPLEVGDIEELGGSPCVRCPYHGWRFDLRTGECRFPGRHGAAAAVFPVRVERSGTLWVGFRAFHPGYFQAFED